MYTCSRTHRALLEGDYRDIPDLRFSIQMVVADTVLLIEVTEGADAVLHVQRFAWLTKQQGISDRETLLDAERFCARPRRREVGVVAGRLVTERTGIAYRRPQC